MDREYVAFKKDGTLLTKEDITLLKKKFSLEKLFEKDGSEIFYFNIKGKVGDIIYSPLETTITFYDLDGERIKKLFETKYGLMLK